MSSIISDFSIDLDDFLSKMQTRLSDNKISHDEYKNTLENEEKRRLAYNRSLYEALMYPPDSVSQSSLEASVPRSTKDQDYQTFNKKMLDRSENGEISHEEYKDEILKEFERRSAYSRSLYEALGYPPEPAKSRG